MPSIIFTIFLCLLSGSFQLALGQPSVRVHRIGYLTAGSEGSRKQQVAAFHQGMQELGYANGTNYLMEGRYGAGKFDRLPALLKELIDWKPDVLLISSTPANLTAKSANLDIPRVMVGVADPIGVGLIKSLAKPGGNLTGVTNIVAELTGKRLEILKESVTNLSRVAVVVNPGDANAPLQLRHAEAAARGLGLQLQPILHLRRAAELKNVFKGAVAAGAQAAIRMVDPLNSALRRETAQLAIQHRLPMIFPFRQDAEAGGLLSYGSNSIDQYRQTAKFVDKILNGTKPGEIPVE